MDKSLGLNGIVLCWSQFLPSILSAVPSPPSNLSLAKLLPDRAVAAWTVDESDVISGFQISVVRLSRSRVEDEAETLRTRLSRDTRSFLLAPLHPRTEYEVLVTAVNGDGASNASDTLTFRTLEDLSAGSGGLHVHAGEVLVVTFILAVWLCAVTMFLHNWGKIRLVPAGQSSYHQCPKNLHTIKVVKKATDSVIYKSYTPEVSKTMVARQKHLERMNTMPNIKLGDPKEDELSTHAANGNRHKYKMFFRTITAPILELGDKGASKV